MTDPTYAHVAILVDRSGSMKDIRSDAEGGIAEFFAEQRKLDGTCTVELYQFDNEFEQVFGPKSIADVGGVTLVPRGTTALLDAMGKAITMTGQRLADTPEHQRPGVVVFAVVTDGKENASREWTREQVFELVRQQQETYGWRFAFLAANQDAIATGADLGVPQASTMTYAATPSGTRAAYRQMSDYTRQARSGGPAAMPDDAEGPE